MAKKKHRKKHQFKYGAVKTQPAGGVAGVTVVPPAEKKLTQPRQHQPATASIQQPLAALNYTKRDVQKTVYFSVGFVVLQLVLWYLFSNTPLGSTVYSLVKI
ncbi:MAG TPA: hypothetical protein VK963_02375 [Candidatus Saccharimonadales bacterium]|nr:hypothetical protein [Candidatus Saccharimonadales bacterium]